MKAALRSPFVWRDVSNKSPQEGGGNAILLAVCGRWLGAPATAKRGLLPVPGGIMSRLITY